MTHDSRVLGVKAHGASGIDGIPRPVLLKFGASRHIEQFAQGLLFMNTLKHFVEIETSSLRMDSHEGTSHMLRGDGAILQVEVNRQFTPIGEIQGPIRYQPDILMNANVFCMHALRENAPDTFVDPRNFDFGDTFAVITDFDEFVRRVRAAALGTGQELQWNLVEYIDETSYVGPVGVFKKVSSFAYQSEFRMVLRPGTGAALRLDVGNLSDIVILGRLPDLNDCLRIHVNAQGRRELQIRN
jgi:hypothetical protein